MLTNKEFGDRVGCSHSMASRLRAGQRLPSVQTMTRISEVFGIPLDDLHAAYRKGHTAMGRLLRERAFCRQPEDVPIPQAANT